MDQFRIDNTEGYTEHDLHVLNCEFERRAVTADGDDAERRQERHQRIMEGVLRDFDSGKL